MKLVRKTEINSTNLTSSTISEDDYSEWSSGTTYSVEDRVISLTTHKVYESQTNSNVGNDPTTYDGTNWLEVSSTNKYKMFDDSYGSQSTDLEEIEVVITPGTRISDIALMNLDAGTVSVSMSVGGSEVYSKEESTLLPNRSDWYEFFFNPIERKKDIIFSDVPALSNGVFTITISGSTGETVGVGLCILGFSTLIGTSLWGATLDIVDYSKKEKDIFGGYTILERSFSSTMKDTVAIEIGRAGYIKNILAEYRTTPALWVATEDIEGLYIYGFYRDFSISLPNPAWAQCEIEIEGLV